MPNLHPVQHCPSNSRSYLFGLILSPKGINCIFIAAQAISKVLSDKISYYTVLARIRIFSLPGHDVPLDEM